MDTPYKDAALTVKPLPAMRLQWLHMERAKVTGATPGGTNFILSANGGGGEFFSERQLQFAVGLTRRARTWLSSPISNGGRNRTHRKHQSCTQGGRHRESKESCPQNWGRGRFRH